MKWNRPSTTEELRGTADWLDQHVVEMYEELTAAGPLRIGGLVRAAGDLFPDVLPDRAVRESDELRPMAQRLHIERDQAQLIRALLDEPATSAKTLAQMRTPLRESAAASERFEDKGLLELTTVKVERRAGFAEVTLCNTTTLNAETNQLVRDLEISVDVVSVSPSVAVGVLRGAPMEHRAYAGRRVFSAGINLKELAAGRISFLDFLVEREAGLLAKLLRGVRLAESEADLACPWIAVVDGFAIGGGMQLTLVCDHVVAVDEAWLSLPAAKEGIVPGVANLRLPNRVGASVARDLILLGRKLSGPEARSVGLVDAVVEGAGVDGYLADIGAALSEPAVAANKQMLNLGIEPESEFAAYLAEFAVVQAYRMHAQDVHRKLPEVR